MKKRLCGTQSRNTHYKKDGKKGSKRDHPFFLLLVDEVCGRVSRMSGHHGDNLVGK